MQAQTEQWDILVVTASNDQQAEAYRRQLDLRRNLGLLAGVGEVRVVADPQGRRVGSGGSTLWCLLQVLSARLGGQALTASDRWHEVFSELRILIVHAGGDSRRLPAYGPCGKLFVPVPGQTDSALPVTLFDRQLPRYLDLPPGPAGAGQIIIVSGDVLLGFDAGQVRLDRPGMTGLACPSEPEQASRHGVYCPDPDGGVRRFLQKPDVQTQQAEGAIDRFGQSYLDIGVVSFDASTACQLLRVCDPAPVDGQLTWTGPIGEAILSGGLDFYREICCALGSQSDRDTYGQAVAQAGSAMEANHLNRLYDALQPIEFSVEILSHCEFLHFGTTSQILTSGYRLQAADEGVSRIESPLMLCSLQGPSGGVTGQGSWLEACRIDAPCRLGGRNVVVGLDVQSELVLPDGACLDVLAGRDRSGQDVWFVRCYGVDDPIKPALGEGARLANQELGQWMTSAGLEADDLWPADTPAENRSLWTARLFPAVGDHQQYNRWLWMFDPASATVDQKRELAAADRYSLEQIALQADQDAYHARRARLRAGQIHTALRRLFGSDSEFSAAELAWAMRHSDDPTGLVMDLFGEARYQAGDQQARPGLGAFAVSRILHSIGRALEICREDGSASALLRALPQRMRPEMRVWLGEQGIEIRAADAAQVADQLRDAAFAVHSRTIVSSGADKDAPPRSALRRDEIVWGRAPARLDLGGGWSDTPPYTLERGGSVINAAVDLNGQPPIHCYARVIGEPVIRIASIDLGQRVEVASLDDLWDYRSPTSEFALAKAALAISGFSPHAADWPGDATLARMLDLFGGGIELTTLAAIPKGSGLGTSSMVGSVILAVIQRLFGRQVTRDRLFHGVLRLEQALTTGGGWQDQIGGSVDGVKVATTEPGLIPEARIHYVPTDVLDPHRNGGTTLLYYTGITRLAKNILQQVVGRYLDRDRAAMATLRRIQALAPRVADAMSRKDLPSFGRLIAEAWQLNKQLDPESSNERIEQLLSRVEDRLLGAKLLGAGGGGFLLMVCRSPEHAQSVRKELTDDPPNDLARFFDFAISDQGLVVTVC